MRLRCSLALSMKVPAAIRIARIKRSMRRSLVQVLASTASAAAAGTPCTGDSNFYAPAPLRPFGDSPWTPSLSLKRNLACEYGPQSRFLIQQTRRCQHPGQCIACTDHTRRVRRSTGDHAVTQHGRSDEVAGKRDGGCHFLRRCVVADHPAHDPEVSPQLRTAGQLRLEGGCKRCRTMSALYDDSSRARDKLDGQNAKQRLGR